MGPNDLRAIAASSSLPGGRTAMRASSGDSPSSDSRSGPARPAIPGRPDLRGRRLPVVDLKDATLMMLSESAAHPAVASLAQSAYDQLISDGEVDYHVLSDMIGEASGKGVLRAIHHKYSATA